MSAPKSITERDRFWLEHEAAIRKSGQSAKDYAAEHELSLHALYQSRKRLRRLGHLPPAKSEARSEKKSTRTKPRFEPVRLTAPALEGRSAYRLLLPGGLVFEWSGDALPDAVVDIVERLVRLR